MLISINTSPGNIEKTSKLLIKFFFYANFSFWTYHGVISDVLLQLGYFLGTGKIKQLLHSQKDVSGNHSFKLITASIEHSTLFCTKVQR